MNISPELLSKVITKLVPEKFQDHTNKLISSLSNPLSALLALINRIGW